MKGLAPTLLVTLLHLSIWCASGQSTGRIVAHPGQLVPPCMILLRLTNPATSFI